MQDKKVEGKHLKEPRVTKRGSVPRVPEELLGQLPQGLLREVMAGESYVVSNGARDVLLSRFESKLVHRPEFKTLTTSTPDKGKPILGWFFYKEAFASSLVQRIVQDARLPTGSLVLDPFGGIGTVPFVCHELGIHAVSTDMSPLPVFVANTKLKATQRDCSVDLIALGEDVVKAIKGGTATRTLPDVSIWQKSFDEDVAHGLFSALELLQQRRSDASVSADVCDIAHLALLCVAEEVSHAVKDGTSLRLREPGRRLGRAGVTKTTQDLAARYSAQVQLMAHDIKNFRAQLVGDGGLRRCENNSRVGDARQIAAIFPQESIDLVVTSPPYPNRYDYSAIYTLELLLGFVRDRDELRALRFDLFRSHLEAPWPDSVRGLTIAVQEILSCLYAEGMSSPRVFKMILGYFSDIAETLAQLLVVMKSGAAAYFVVGNVRIQGQEVPVDLILADIAQSLGFEVEAITVARLKGTNSQQSKKFGAGRLRESIVSFRKH